MDLKSGCTVVNCTAIENTLDGIVTNKGCTVRNCSASGNGDDGFALGAASTITGCTASANVGDGIEAFNDCRIVGNTCDGNGAGLGNAAGIHLLSGDCRVEGNNVTDNDRGIDVDFAGNIIIKNTASGNGVNYSIVAGNSVGAILNVAGATITTTNPWRNFEF